MKRIIEGKTYNTETSAVVAQYEYTDETDGEVEAKVYINNGGALFIVHRWEDDGASKYYFEPTTRERVAALMAKKFIRNFEIFDEMALESPPEAEAEEEPAATVYTRVPAPLKDRVDEAASEAKLSVNSYMLRCMEQCLTKPRDYEELCQIWEIAATFRAHPDGDWSTEKCIEALKEIADLAEDLAKKMFPDERDPLVNAFTGDEPWQQRVREEYNPFPS
jgi:hypothetical protein